MHISNIKDDVVGLVLRLRREEYTAPLEGMPITSPLEEARHGPVQTLNEDELSAKLLLQGRTISASCAERVVVQVLRTRKLIGRLDTYEVLGLDPSLGPIPAFIGDWGVSSTGKSFRFVSFVRACVRAVRL